MFKTKITGKVCSAAVPLYYPSEKGNMKFTVKTPSGSFPIMIPQSLYRKNSFDLDDEVIADVYLKSNEWNGNNFINLYCTKISFVKEKPVKKMQANDMFLSPSEYDKPVQHLQPNHEFVNNNDSEAPF